MGLLGRKMKMKISVALNILSIASLVAMALYNRVRENKYRQTTRVVLLHAASKIDAGKPELVSRILKEVPRDPHCQQLFSMSQKLAAIGSAEQVPSRSLPPSQQSTAPSRGSED
jgi:hypothetical protein